MPHVDGLGRQTDVGFYRGVLPGFEAVEALSGTVRGVSGSQRAAGGGLAAVSSAGG